MRWINLWFMRLYFPKDITFYSGETMWAGGWSHWVEDMETRTVVWSRSCPAASLPIPSAKPPTLLVSCMVLLLPLKEWSLINVMNCSIYLIPPTSGPESIPRSCISPCALEKSHPRIHKWEENMTCCSRRMKVRKRC